MDRAKLVAVCKSAAAAAEFGRSWIINLKAFVTASAGCSNTNYWGQSMNNTATGYCRMIHPCPVKNYNDCYIKISCCHYNAAIAKVGVMKQQPTWT